VHARCLRLVLDQLDQLVSVDDLAGRKRQVTAGAKALASTIFSRPSRMSFIRLRMPSVRLVPRLVGAPQRHRVGCDAQRRAHCIDELA